jgi:chromosome segregation ATPase
MDRNEVEAKLAAAEDRRREAEERLAQNLQRLEQLEEERAELLGASAIAKRGLADFDEYREQLHAQLAAIEVDEARLAFEEALGGRDQALDRAAESLEDVVKAVAEVQAARQSVVETHRRLTKLDPAASRVVPSEPSTFEERWRDAAPLLESELNRKLEIEMINAAVRSPNSRAIDQLPEHLRELAQQRLRDVMRDQAMRDDAHERRR